MMSLTGHTGNIVNPSITSSTTPLSYSESSAIDIISLNTTKQDVLSSHEPSTIDQALPQTTFNTFGVTDRPAVADDHDSHDYEKLKVNYQKVIIIIIICIATYTHVHSYHNKTGTKNILTYMNPYSPLYNSVFSSV